MHDQHLSDEATSIHLMDAVSSDQVLKNQMRGLLVSVQTEQAEELV